MIDEQKLKNILKEVRKPGRYTGGEWNEVKKDFRSVKVKIALVFPDVYEIGMSHLGQKILYSILNEDPDILAERVYTPGLDFEEKIGTQDLTLFSLENKIPLSKFDILGFSLLYELNYSNILTVLDLGNIPLYSSERFNMTPLIIGGGPAAFNPEPVSEIFDLFLVGDGEEAFLEIIKEFEHLKKETNDKQEVLKELSRIKGVYIPCFYKSFFPNNSLLQAVKPVNDAPEKIKKRIISPFNQSYFPEKILVPNIRTIFDRVSLEVARGCPQKCRFCQASSLYFPYRARNPSFIVKNALSNLKNTGYEELSLTSLSISDYPILDTIVEELMRRLNKKKISLSLSSLRPKGLSSSIAENIIKVRKTGFTVVPEAGTERLRRVINKNLSDEELFNAVTNAFSKGWRLIKLYFMVGLPTETEEDLHGMIDLIKDVIKYGYKYLKKSPKINLSIASFIPKAHTPFQWLAMEDEDALIEKQRYIKSELKKYPFVRIKWHPVKNSLLEAIFSRGDRRLSKVLFRAWKMGARFDSWSDCFDMNIWEKSFEQENIDYKIYLSSLDTKSVLPWEHIDTGIKKSHLIKELNKAWNEKYTYSCIDNDCQLCGGCSLGHMIEYDVPNQINVPEEKTEYFGEKKKEWIIYRATYLKCHQSRYLSHVELSNAIQRSFRRAGISIVHSQGFHPKMILSFLPALPLGMEGKEEMLEFKSYYFFNKKNFLKRINKYLPSGLEFIDLEKIKKSKFTLNKNIKTFVYSLDLNNEEVKKAIGSVLGKEKLFSPDYYFEILDKRIEEYLVQKKEEVIEKIYIERKINKLFIHINFYQQKQIRPHDIVKDLLPIDNPVFSMAREKTFMNELN